MILVVTLVMCFPVVCVWWGGGCGAADSGAAEIRRTSVCPNGMGAAVAAVCVALRNLAVWSWRRARRRMRARVEQVVDEEVRQQVAREVLRHLQDGPAHSNGKGEP